MDGKNCSIDNIYRLDGRVPLSCFRTQCLWQVSQR